MKTEHPAPPVPGRLEIIRSFRETGGHIAAVFPIHYPRSLLRAFGVLPVEVWGPPRANVDLGNAHLQAYTCSIARCGAGYILEGKLDIADMILVPHACDSLQGLGSILLDFVRPGRPVLPFCLPRGEGQPAGDFALEELRALYARLEEITGRTPSEQDMAAALAREENADARLAELLAARRFLPVDDTQFYRLVRAREYLPAERFSKAAGELLECRQKEPIEGIPLVLSGILPEPGDILRVIGEAGGFVAGDDLCSSGRRLYPAASGNSVLGRMADRLLKGPPDSTRGSPVSARVRYLKEIVERSGAGGLVFYNIKFCEPEQFYLPQVRTALEAAGVRSLAAEVDLGERLPDQIVTRIEAFLETLA